MTGDRISVWVCDECGYWRQEKTTGRHQTTNPADPTGRMVVHLLRSAEFVDVAAYDALAARVAALEQAAEAVRGEIREALLNIGREIHREHVDRIDHGYILQQVDGAIAAARAALADVERQQGTT